jgi:hypothetical protein
MRPKHLAGFLAILAALLLPGVAHAETCGSYFWCDSYVMYDSPSNAVSGYSTTEDWYFEYYYVGAQAYLLDPNGALIDYAA